MKKHIVTCAAALLLASAAAAHAQDVDNPITVFVKAAARPAADTRTSKERAAALRQAQMPLKELEKSLKSQYGKKQDRWPADAQQRFSLASEPAALAAVDVLYHDWNESAGDSVEDVQHAITGEGLEKPRTNVRLVNSEAEAQLVVEIRNRRSKMGSGALLQMAVNKSVYVLFSIKAGPKATTAQFAAIPRTFSYMKVAGPRPGAPEWLFEAVGMTAWRTAGRVIADTVDTFAKANRGLLTETVVAAQ